MDHPVQDGIGNGRVADMVMPVLNGKLTRNEGGSCTVAVLDNFQKVSSFGVG